MRSACGNGDGLEAGLGQGHYAGRADPAGADHGDGFVFELGRVGDVQLAHEE